MPGTTKPNTHEMVVIHRVFRREFQLLPDLIEQVAGGNTQRAAVLAEHLTDLVSSLHHHHEGEDDLLWPVLLAKATLQTELVHRMESQHEALSTALEKVEKLTPAWAATANPADRDELAKAVRESSVILEEHMAEEEKEILPVVDEHLTAEEWDKLGDRGAKSISDKRKRLLFLGMILEEATPAEAELFWIHIPAPVKLLWKVIGRRQYDGYVRVIRRPA
jgi:hemerythrin-like domain-containing protein